MQLIQWPDSDGVERVGMFPVGSLDFAQAILEMGWQLENPLTGEAFVEVGPAGLWPGHLRVIDES
jgi:hypothetical protein